MTLITHPAIQTIKIEQILNALCEPLRLQIIASLKQNGETPCCEFDYLGKKNNLSHHLKVLRENGLIHVRVDGRQRFISLRMPELEQKFPHLIDTIIYNYLCNI